MLSIGIKKCILVFCLVNFGCHVSFSHASDQINSKKCSEKLLPTLNSAILELNKLSDSENHKKLCD